MSQYLRVLRKAGIVVSEKRGYFIHYRLNDETQEKWRRIVKELLDNKRGGSSGKAGVSDCGRQGWKSSGGRSWKS